MENSNYNITLSPIGTIGTTIPSMDRDHPDIVGVVVTIAMVVAVLIVATNTLTIICIAKFKHLQQMNANKFILSLSCADLVLGVGLLTGAFRFYAPNLVEYYGNQDTPKIYCLTPHHMVTLGTYSSILNFLLVVIDRFISIARPYFHTRWFTERNSKIIICMTWLYSTGCYIIMKSTTEYKYGEPCLWAVIDRKTFLMLTTHVLGVLLVSTLAYTYIFTVAWKQRKQIQAQERSMSGAEITTKDFKLTKMIAWVYGVLMLCFVPFAITTALSAQYQHAPGWLQAIYRFSCIMIFCNSFSNAIIYGLKSEDFRLAYRTLLCCKIETKHMKHQKGKPGSENSDETTL